MICATNTDKFDIYTKICSLHSNAIEPFDNSVLTCNRFGAKQSPSIRTNESKCVNKHHLNVSNVQIFQIWYACMSMDRYQNVDVGKIVPLPLWLCASLHTENVFIWFLRANISHVIIFAWLPTFPSAGYLIPCCYLKEEFLMYRMNRTYLSNHYRNRTNEVCQQIMSDYFQILSYFHSYVRIMLWKYKLNTNFLAIFLVCI